MNIHEYQAKELLQKFDVATTRGRVATTLDEAEQIARELGDIDIVVKAQIHAGGRGKGSFKNGFKGGVHVRKTPDEVRDVAAKMLGQILVTHQTGSAGRLVNKVLVAESADISREIYFAVLLDRATAAPLIVASTEGGVEIEAVAAKSPEKIIREPIDPLAGLQPYQARKLASQLGFESSQLKNASKLFDGLYRTFIAYDCSMVEVNPLVVTNKGEVLALDAKFAAARAEYAFYQVARILNGRSNDASLFDKAESEARHALRDDARCGRAHSVLALIYLLQGRKELVPGEVDQALKENPTDATAQGWLLHYHEFNGDYQQAREQADRLVRQWPLYWAAHLSLGELLREQGDVDGAIREQERVLEQDPQNVDGLASLSRAYIDKHDLHNARQTLERARKEDRENYSLRQTWALLLALEGHKAQATQEMDAGLQAYAAMQIFGPSSAADFYAVMGDADRALEWLERAVRMGDYREEYLRRNPLLESLRAQPRFQQILDSVAYRRRQPTAR